MQRTLLLITAMMLTALYSSSQELKEIFMKRELDLDSSFINNSIRYKPKKSRTVSNKKMTKISFGPFQLIKALKDKGQVTSKTKGKDVFSKYSETESTHKGALTILFEKKDTVFVDLLLQATNYTRGKTMFGSMLSPNKEDESGHSTRCTEMSIQLPGDTAVWNLVLFNDKPFMTAISNNDLGTLISSTDTIEIKHAIGYKNMVKILAGYTTGIIFIKDNKSIAAHQFGKDYVWLSTTEEEKYRVLVGSCILALICVGEE